MCEVAANTSERLTRSSRHADGAAFLRHTEAFLLRNDGGPVSTAMWARPTPNGVTINGVYSRGLGAAAVTHRPCVAALSQRMLDEGREFCCLCTDLSKRTSNDIYLSIGYQPVCDSDDYLFE